MPTAKPSKPRKPVLTRTITIEGTFGSGMQREIALRTLMDILEIWRREVEKRHKKNAVTITQDE